jgi:hypothetical protein
MKQPRKKMHPPTTSGTRITALLLFMLLTALFKNHDIVMIGKATAATPALLAATAVPTTTTKYVEMGICENVQTGSKRCAMQASDCQFDHWNGEMSVHLEAFFSAFEQEQFGYHQDDASSSLCTCENTQIGSCNDRCSPQRYGYCFTNESFVEMFSSSTTAPLADLSSSRSSSSSSNSNNDCSCHTANYGACQNAVTGQYFCAFSPNDCVVDGHFWIHPQDTQEAIGIICTCDKVRVGGCVGDHGQKFTCAVSSDDCQRVEHYQEPYTLKLTTGRMCNLCKPLSTSTTSDESSVVPYEDELTNMDKEETGAGSNNNGVPSGLSRVARTFLSLLAFAVIVALVLFLYSKRTSAKRTESTSSNDSGVASEWKILRRNKSSSKYLEVSASSSQDSDQMFPCVMAKGPDAEII